MSKARLPETPEIAVRLLLFLWRRAKPMEPKEIYDPLADHLSLSPQQLGLKRNTRLTERLWDNYVQTARKQLVEQGFMSGDLRGFWFLTDAGREKAAYIDKNANASADDLGL